MLDRTALLGLLEDLAAELSAMGVRGEMFHRRGPQRWHSPATPGVSTHDIDAVFEPKAVIYAAAERVAAAAGA